MARADRGAELGREAPGAGRPRSALPQPLYGYFSALEAAAGGKCIEGIVDPSYMRLLFYTDPPDVPLASGASFRCFS